jgi:hypothetical protein
MCGSCGDGLPDLSEASCDAGVTDWMFCETLFGFATFPSLPIKFQLLFSNQLLI